MISAFFFLFLVPLFDPLRIDDDFSETPSATSLFLFGCGWPALRGNWEEDEEEEQRLTSQFPQRRRYGQPRGADGRQEAAGQSNHRRPRDAFDQ